MWRQAGDMIRQMLNRSLSCVVAVSMLAIFGCGGSTTKAKEWHEGGTLHKKSGREWMNASAADQLATSADFAAKVFKTNSMDELKTRASQMASCISEAVPASPERPVSEIGGACAVLLGAK
jgi:hypothetical protein